MGMASQRRIAWMAVLLGGLGCGSERTALVAAELPRMTGSTAVASPVERMQKPDNPVTPPASLSLVNEQFAGPPGGQVAARILANVNGIPILYEEVVQECSPALRQTDSLPEPERSLKRKEIVTAVLQKIIDREVVLQEALPRIQKNPQGYAKFKDAAEKEFERQVRSIKQTSGIKSDEQLKQVMHAQGMSFEAMKRKTEREFMALEYMRSKIFRSIEKIGHEELWQYYNDHLSDFQTVDAVQWLDIFIDSSRYPTRTAGKALAEQLVQRAKRGEDFQALCRQFDNGDSSYRNGQGYGSHRGEIKPVEAEAFLFAMKPGEVAPVVEMSTGFHVIKLMKREYAGQMPFDEKIQADVKRRLQNEVGEREYKRLLQDLKRKAVIEYAE